MVLLIVQNTVSAQSVIFVDHSAVGANDGSSWHDAHVSLQDALETAASGDEVWVAAGTYRPDRGDSVDIGSRDATFVIGAGVSLLGGFAGTESIAAERNPHVNVTILSGDLVENDAPPVTENNPTRIDNSYQVARVSSFGGPAVTLSGFVISGGHGIPSPRGTDGAAIGVYGPAHLHDLTIEDNFAWRGGGLHTIAEDSLTVKDSRFSGNVAIETGGGLYTAAPLFLFNCQFTNNEAGGGGAMYISEGGSLHAANITVYGNRASSGAGFDTESDRSPSHPIRITNALFYSNHASWRGGAMFSLSRDFELSNSVIAYNHADSAGGGISHFSADDSLMILNTVIWGNSAPSGSQVDVSTFQDDSPGVILRRSAFDGALPPNVHDDGTTVFSDPLFQNPSGLDGIAGTTDDDFRLLARSPLIDAGDNTFVPNDFIDVDMDSVLSESFPVDADLNRRIFDGGSGAERVDIGAFEYGAPTVVLSVDEQVTAEGSISSDCNVYPNPFESTVSIQGFPGPATLYIYDVGGRLVKQIEASRIQRDSEIEVSLTEMSSGPFFLVAQSLHARCTTVLFKTK